MASAVYQYADEALKIAGGEEFEIIHAHDWMTFPAAIAIAEATRKPLIVHVHSTEFDRSGEHVNQMVYDIERQGMHAADKVIAVSHYTRNIIVNRYSVPAEKVEVVYNGVECKKTGDFPTQMLPAPKDRIVLFLGRITMQKGPEYFLYAAKRVLEKLDNVKFIMAGAGDMLDRSIELAANLGIGHKVRFTHFLRGAEVDRVYKMSDVYVMPSVSEPFGISPLEALKHGIPVLISKQSGISEVLSHALKVDFWDVNQMANKIIAVLKHPALHKALRDNGSREINKLRWKDAATRIYQIYTETVN
jgi:glycosyltransferase involved in cell wall biosynthesis